MNDLARQSLDRSRHFGLSRLSSRVARLAEEPRYLWSRLQEPVMSLLVRLIGVAQRGLFLLVAGAQIVAGTECVARYRPQRTHQAR